MMVGARILLSQFDFKLAVLNRNADDPDLSLFVMQGL